MSDPFTPDEPLAEGAPGTPLAIDTDGDGSADLVAADPTGDGQADWLATTDESGATTVVADTDGRAGWDTMTSDADSDGRPEVLVRDLDADGLADLAQLDLNSDGFLETTSLADGTVLQTDPTSGVVTILQPGTPVAPDQGIPVIAPTDVDVTPDAPIVPLPDPVVPDVTGPDDTPNIHGDFVDDRPYTQIQTEDGFCAPVSVGMVISEFFGRVVTEEETVDAAIELGFLTHDSEGWSGLTVFDTEKLVEHFGISAHIEPPIDPVTGEFLDPVTPDEALDNLGEHLDANHGVVLMVDADEVWTDVEDDGTFGDGMDHAVVIRQINEETGTVILNDPGNPDGGREWEMSIEDFMEAWDDSGYAMVVTDEAPDAAAYASKDAPAGEAKAGGMSYAGFVILPVVVAADRLRRRSRI